MPQKRLRQIAALEAELAMTEAHAQKLSTIVASEVGPGEENPMRALLQEERDRAEGLRRKIHLLKGHSE